MAKKELKLNYNTFATTHSRDYYRGQSFHFSGEWLVGAHYLSDDYNVDFVVHDQVLLACAKSHLSTTENEPKDFIKDESGTIIGVVSTYWDFVLSGIVGNSPGIKIVDNYWYTCANIGVPEEEQVWVNTGVKAKMELSDLTPADIELLQRPGKEVVTEFVNTTITQELGNDPTKILSQAGVTTALNTKASLAQLNAAIQNEVLRANNTYQSKGDYATNTRVNELESTITDLEDDITDDIDDINDAISDIQSDIDTLEGNIPTKVSQLENDSKYQTKTNLDNALSPITAVIPEQANALNKLADKNYVDTIATGKLDTSLKGANNGLAELDENGLIPSSQLPAFVDDILEYSSVSLFPQTGESGKIYVDTTTNITYRWSGSQYVEISESLALGETSSTAYRGDRGKTAYDHATDNSKISAAVNNGFYKIGATAEGHIGSLVAVTKNDITGFNLNKSDVGLSNVDNTSDANKPVSTATQTELDKKLEGVQVDGADLTITNKKVNIDLSGKVDVAESAVVDDAFLFRPTGNNLTIDAKVGKVREVKGKSLVWNQLVDIGVTLRADNHSFISNGILTSSCYSAGQLNQWNCGLDGVYGSHKYYTILKYKSTINFKYGFVGTSNMINASSASEWTLLKVITNGNFYQRTFYFQVPAANNPTTSDTLQFKDISVLDLTLLGIDDLTTVAEIESWLAENIGEAPYYPYNAGTILNNKLTAIESTGFNLLNPTTGKAKIIGEYSSIYDSYYGITGTYGTLTFTDNFGNTSTITPDSDGKFLLESAGELDVASASSDCAVFQWWNGSRTEYEKYNKDTAYLDVTHIYGKLNGEGSLVQVWPSGMPGLSDELRDTLTIKGGQVVAKKMVGDQDLGAQSMSWNYNSTKNLFASNLSNAVVPNSSAVAANILCAKYKTNSQNVNENHVNGIALYSPTYKYLTVSDSSAGTDAVAFKTAMSGVLLYYELATPETYTDLVYQGSSYFADGTAVTLPTYRVDKHGTERVLPVNTSSSITTTAFTGTIIYNEANIKTNEVEGIEDYENKIERIQINGTDQAIVNKTVNLPAYPTTLPASDVSDWAKQSTKPSYTLDEVTDGSTRKLANYLPLAGGTMSNSNLVTDLNADLLDGKHNGELTAEDTKVELKTDQEFTFRKTNVSWNANAASVQKIKGNSLVWNQQIVDASRSGSGTHTLNNTYLIKDLSTNEYVAKGHKMLVKGRVSLSILPAMFFIQIDNYNAVTLPGSSITANEMFDFAAIANVNTDSWHAVRLYCSGLTEEDGCVMTWENVVMFDLTLMFGAGNEPSTVAEFEAMFPNPYYAYNPGTIINNTAEAVETVGFNLFDNVWENGAIDANGANISVDTQQRSKNYIPVFEDTKYYYYEIGMENSTASIYIYSYDINKNFIEAFTRLRKGGFFTTSSQTRYLRISRYINAETKNSCINVFDDSKNGTYEPYEKHTLTLGLNSFNVKDGQGNITTVQGLKSAGTVKDELDLARQKFVQRVGTVDLGTLNWTYTSGSPYNWMVSDALTNAKASNTSVANFITALTFGHYAFDALYQQYPTENGIAINAAGKIIVRDSAYSDAATFKTAMSGVMLNYELATPIEYDLVDPIYTIYNCNKYGTERILPEGVDTNGVPKTTRFIGDIQYGLTQKNIVDIIPTSLSDLSDSPNSVTDLVLNGSLSGNAFKVIAEHIAKLTSRIESLESGIGVVNTLSSNSVDSANGYYINGDKTVIIGTGVPTVVPAFAGQFYINTSGPALYYAINNSAATDWKQA